MKVSEALERALDVINNDGWFQGSFAEDAKNPDSPVCSLGAINKILSDDRNPIGWLTYEQNDLFKKAEITLESVTCRAIALWNDSPNTTIEDVNLVFEQAIYTAKENEL